MKIIELLKFSGFQDIELNLHRGSLYLIMY